MTQPVAAKNEARSGTAHAPASLPIELIPGLGVLVDAGVILSAGFGAYLVGFPLEEGMPARLVFMILMALVGMIVAAHTARSYRLEALLAPLRSLKKLTFAFLLVLLGVWFVGSELFADRPRSLDWLYRFPLFMVAGLVFVRVFGFLLLYVLATQGRICRKIAVFGAGAQAEKLLAHIAQETPHINRVIGVFDDRLDRGPQEVGGLPVLGTTKDLLKQARQQDIDEVIIALPWSADKRVLSLIEALRELPVKVRLASDLVTFQFPGQVVADDLFRGLPMFDIVQKPLAGWSLIVKSVEDKILAALAILLLSPVFILVALAIKIESRGPVLFRQKRYGFNNQEFSVLKFRSMKHAYDPLSGSKQATKDDPRITRVGRFIRRTSLDELPQFFNVLGGSMSMVGPRPHSVQHNEQYAIEIDGYLVRHKVKPGVTGWAQVNGLRGETDTLEKMEYRVRYDIYYIENWSLLFDLEILMLTLLLGIVGKNAY